MSDINCLHYSGNYKNINKWLGELKNIDSSLKRLDKEISSSAKLIGAWGNPEGEDMADVCQRMTQIMEEVGLIQQAYSIHHTAYRKTIKSLKTQEMFLDDNRKKKHDLTAQITKHQKSSKENPIKLMELQSALERVSAELLTQELQLLQFKRVTIRDAFNAQFDAMIEYGEKMALIAGYGRQITEVIDCGPQEPHCATLYSGSEYTAAAINQVKVAVTTWQAQPVGNSIREHIAPSENELRMSSATYMNGTTSVMEPYAESHSDGPLEHGVPGDISSGYWNEVQMLKGNNSQTSLKDGQGSEFEHWKQELQDYADRSDDYISPPDSNPDASPYLQSQQVNQLQEQQRQLQLEQQRARHHTYSPKSSPSQQHYQNAASAVATSLRRSSDTGSPQVRALTPIRRGDSTDKFHPRSTSPGPNYISYQQQSATYDSAPARGYRLGFSDPRERNRSERSERMDNSDLYRSDMSSSTTIASRFTTRAPAIMDEK
ncbi:Eisosome component PIL1-domain-containing protein [Mortierella sp. GBAus27b]|nr:hypothetical protein BGX31_001263 [Mortierella sp. GBA43]KAI8361529.1 Eisosome component PIL1-domain-containing protein [Mortierella sp. GBAus27b]